MTKTKFQEY